MLNALSIFLRDGNPGGRVRARESLERQGFVAAGSFDWQEGVLDMWSRPSQFTAEHRCIRTGEGFACCVGPLWYRGRFGEAGLRSLMAEVDEIDERELRGNFALFLRKDEHCVLMNDPLGLVRVYVSADRSFHSTSWLATCAYVGPVELDQDAAAEYVLLGASHSDSTVARGVTSLPLAHTFDLTRRRTRSRFATSFWTSGRVPASFDEAVAEADALLRTIFKEVATAFPGRVRTALSGGFDSRLILAGLLACGECPELFVYGDQASEDVPIARAVAASAGIPLEVIDKGALDKRLAPTRR